jgi:hypothetical protein
VTILTPGLRDQTRAVVHHVHPFTTAPAGISPTHVLPVPARLVADVAGSAHVCQRCCPPPALPPLSNETSSRRWPRSSGRDRWSGNGSRHRVDRRRPVTGDRRRWSLFRWASPPHLHIRAVHTSGRRLDMGHDVVGRDNRAVADRLAAHGVACARDREVGSSEQDFSLTGKEAGGNRTATIACFAYG